MAILGFLVHTLPGTAEQVEKEVAAMPEMTTYGIHQNEYIVTVAEAPEAELEYCLAKVRSVEGVLTAYVTSMTNEDETFPEDE